MLKRFANVRIELESHPESVALVRAVLSGIAEWRELDLELLNDLKTAISEACNNVIVHAYEGAAGPVAVDVRADPAGLTTWVRDHGIGFQAVTARDDGMGVGLAVMSALAARAEFATPADGGTEVRMWFPATDEDSRPLAHFADPLHLDGEPHEREPFSDGEPSFDAASSFDRAALPGGPSSSEMAPSFDGIPSAPDLHGDVRVTVSPVSLTTPVLGRLARALAATAKFSFDRFSDVYLVADTLGAHAQRTAASDRVSFALAGSRKRLELSIGPFGSGTGDRLKRHVDAEQEADSPLALLADEITVVDDGDSEMLRVVLQDRDEPARRAAADY